jgi:hypothetical protein
VSPPVPPEGLVYERGFLSEEEEAEVLSKRHEHAFGVAFRALRRAYTRSDSR